MLGFDYSHRRRDGLISGVATQRDSQVLQNVRREVALMKKLVHPNVVRLLEVIDDPQNDLLFMVRALEKGNGGVREWGGGRGARRQRREGAGT